MTLVSPTVQDGSEWTKEGFGVKASTDETFQRTLIFWFTGPLAAFIILANLFIIVGIVFNRKCYNTANYFFLSLLSADFFTGVALPCIPRMRFDKDLGYHGCLLVYIMPNFFFLTFLANLLMVHYEKYLCIVHPLHYRTLWVHRCVPLALLLVWALPLLFASLPMVGWNNWNENATCCPRYTFPKAYLYLEIYGFLIPAILAIAFITVKVLVVARRTQMDIKKLHRSVQRGGRSELEQQMDLRYAKCIASVSLTFLVCWVPYIACLHVSVLAMEQYDISWLTLAILTCLGSGSTAVIPVMLGLSHKQYTELWRNTFGRCCRVWHRPPHKPATTVGQAKPQKADDLLT
ncbi:G-protein coupled bile acid receptor 1 [Ambystoma mexicanum]|uniref:G-protein coupled bile acid receptor 1 n=1 Tax=Ambystoma mexicanum TaxID=8296 RepID=UPI0037E9C31F